MYKNCISDQIQWSEITKISDHYCSIKMLYQKRSQQSWTAVRCVQKVYFLLKILGENTLVRRVQKLRFWPNSVVRNDQKFLPLLQSQNVVSNYQITFRAEWNVDKPSIWPNCALSDKSTEVGRGRFACFELIRCGATVGSGGLGPRPCPNMVKSWNLSERSYVVYFWTKMAATEY